MPIQSMILELDNSLLITSHNYQLLDKKKMVCFNNNKKILELTQLGSHSGSTNLPSHLGLTSFMSKLIQKET
jgi:hypothetical protein